MKITTGDGIFHVVDLIGEWAASFREEKDANLFVRAAEIHDAFEAGAQEIADKFGDFDVDIRRIN